jgi:hypothetical protein
MAERPDEAWLLQLLGPLTEALMVIHAARWYHRDIAPDNVVMLAATSRPLLLDFGAARRVIGESTQALTAILKPGYAPIEQYAEVPGMKQGAWTDVYALAAVVYWAITGKTPPAAVGRMLNDTCEPLVGLAAGRYSERLLRATDLALAVMPEQRTRSVDEFRRQIGLDDAPAAPMSAAAMAPAALPPRAEFARTALPPPPTPPMPPMPPAQPVGMPATASGPAPGVAAEDDQATIVRPPPPRTGAPAHGLAWDSPARRTWILAGLGVAVAVIAGGTWLGQRSPASGAAPAQSPHATGAETRLPGPAQPSAQSGAVTVTPAPTSPSAQPPTAAPAGTAGQSGEGTRNQPLAPRPAPAQPASTDPLSTPATVRPPLASDGTATARRPVPTSRDPDRAPPARPPRGMAPSPEPSPAAPARRDEVSATQRERECAALLQRVSLGDAGPEAIERLTALKCR